ncbi:MAG: hypothetical protein ACJ760_02005 [Thermoleophilaceae bacterium]
MPARLRPRITYANVVSTLCLFMLLGGGALAASGSFVTGGKIHACARSSSGFVRLERGSHPSCGSGSEAVTWNERGRQGPEGKRGPEGKQGPPGVSEYVKVESGVNLPGNTIGHADAPCPQGETVLSGGYKTPPGSNLHIEDTAPVSGNTVWSVAAKNNSSIEDTLTAVAICAKVK